MIGSNDAIARPQNPETPRRFEKIALPLPPRAIHELRSLPKWQWSSRNSHQRFYPAEYYAPHWLRHDRHLLNRQESKQHTRQSPQAYRVGVG